MPTIDCTTCATKLKLPDGAETQTFKCPKCGSLIEADAAAANESIRRGYSGRSNGSTRRVNDGTVACRYCGEGVLAEARKCKHCGEILDPELAESRSQSRRDTGGFHPYQEEKSSAVAVLLEVLPGLFVQTFGIGHLYAGNTGVGLGFLFGYWALLAVNIVLMFCFVGFFTWPICWVLFLILSPILAAQHCNHVNAEAAARRRG